MRETQSYRIHSQSHWYIILGSKPFFNRFKFIEDEEKVLWFLPEPAVSIDSSASEALVRPNQLFDQFFLSELSRVEKLPDNRARIGIRRYLNFFSKFIVRYEGLSFTVDNFSETDYKLLIAYKNGSFRFFNKL